MKKQEAIPGCMHHGGSYHDSKAQEAICRERARQDGLRKLRERLRHEARLANNPAGSTQETPTTHT